MELEALPALDKLTSKISTLNLERVRHIKSRLVALTARVQRVRNLSPITIFLKPHDIFFIIQNIALESIFFYLDRTTMDVLTT